MKAFESKKAINLILFGNNKSLVYLINRYAEEFGYELFTLDMTSSINEITRIEPSAIIFSSISQLENAQQLIEILYNYDIPILVCTSLVDKIKAVKLGADMCLVHPLTPDNFQKTISMMCYRE